MNKQELTTILDKHAKWLRGEEGGERANLARAYLADADLAGAYLAGANLAGANLTRADLADVDLADAYLARADLAGASAQQNRYVITACLTNYQMALFQHKGTVLVTAGCRRGLRIAEAREHWAIGRQEHWTAKTPEYGNRQRAMLEFLVLQARDLGWPVEAVEALGARDHVKDLESRLAEAASIIETADIRACAVDGPVSHCRDEMTDTEWRRLYVAVKGEGA